jgi:hypothetical protein
MVSVKSLGGQHLRVPLCYTTCLQETLLQFQGLVIVVTFNNVEEWVTTFNSDVYRESWTYQDICYKTFSTFFLNRNFTVESLSAKFFTPRVSCLCYWGLVIKETRTNFSGRWGLFVPRDFVPTVLLFNFACSLYIYNTWLHGHRSLLVPLWLWIKEKELWCRHCVWEFSPLSHPLYHKWSWRVRQTLIWQNVPLTNVVEILLEDRRP